MTRYQAGFFMSEIILYSQSDYDWREEKIRNLEHELAKTVSSNLKEGNWYNYTIRFKKDKDGKVIICNNPANKRY